MIFKTNDRMLPVNFASIGTFGIVALSLVVVTLVAWGFFSRRRSIPCPTWLGWLVERDNPFAKVCRAATIVANADIQAEMTVLDAGCGPGRVTIPAAQKVGLGGEVLALDIQAGMLRRTQEKAEASNLTNIRFLHAGLGEEKLTRGKFDRALLISVLGEIPQQEDALKEIFDALKPNGILSVTEVIFDPHFQRRTAVLRLADAVGFREKERFGNAFTFTLNFEKPHPKSGQN